MSQTAITVRIDSAIADQLKEASEQEGTSQKFIVEAALKAYLQPSADKPSSDNLQAKAIASLDRLEHWTQLADMKFQYLRDGVDEVASSTLQRKVKGKAKGFSQR